MRCDRRSQDRPDKNGKGGSESRQKRLIHRPYNAKTTHHARLGCTVGDSPDTVTMPAGAGSGSSVPLPTGSCALS